MADQGGIEAVQLFIPMDRRLALIRGAALPERTSGAVLFADISGFSLLTAALARDLGAQRGAEELTRHLDRVVGALSAEAQRFHGSVIGFSGDGITCWFDDTGPSTDGCARATACALRMQRVVAALPPITSTSEEPIVVGVKVALAAGPVRRLLVGDAAIQKLEVLSGSTLNRMADAANHASRGEVVASREVIDRLNAAAIAGTWQPSAKNPDLLAIRSLSTPVPEAPWEVSAAIADETARPWVAAPVYERTRVGKGEFLADLRPVVTMFLRFTGLDYDTDPDAGDKLDAYVRWVQTTVEHYGGNLLQLSVDDKGSHLYIVVGALQAYEDALLRAVSAACQLRIPPADLRFIRASQIGISRGRVYAGAYGGALRRVYSVLGHEVNVAARLMELAAAGEILITGRLEKAAGRDFDLEDRGETALKGIAEPCRVFAVRGPRLAPASSPTSDDHLTQVAGRDVETKVLEQHLRTVVAGASASVIIEGAAGIGKSLLVASFVHHVRNEGVSVCVGAADAIARSTAYHVWRDVFVGLLDLPASGGDAADGERTLRAVESKVASFDTPLTHLSPLLGSVLGARFADSPLTAEMTGKVRADNTNDLLVAILQATVRRAPLVIVLEDAHWMDSASWALLQRVRREVAPLLLVISARPLTQPPAEEYAALLRAPTTHLLQLDALSRDDTKALLCRHLGVSSVPAPVLDLIFAKSDGHPFFSEVIGSSLLDADLIHVRGGVCYLSPGTTLESFEAPDTLEGVITSRIDSLGSAEQLTLKVASVIGRAFGFGMLRHTHPVERDERALGRQLDHLTELEMLLEASGTDLEYLFKHVITQEVAYGLLLYRQRRELHRSVAQWYEEHSGDELSAHYPRLAHHWSRAARDEAVDREAVEKALDYLEKAGEQALNAYANEEAVRFFTEALELRSQHAAAGDRISAAKAPLTDPQQARWHHRLSLAYQGLGDLGHCREHAQQGLALLGRPIPPSPTRLFLGVLGQVGWRLATRFARHRAATGSTVQPQDETMRQVAELYIPLARVAYHTNDPLNSLYVNTTKLNLMERLGPSPELAESYGSIGVTLGVFQLHRRADRYVRRAVEVARGSRHSGGLVTAHVISSVYLIGVGQWRRVQEHLEEGRHICEELGDHQQWGDCMAIMADAAFLEGDTARAVRLYEELLAAAQRRNNHLQELWAIRGKATAALREGDPGEAAALLEHAVVLLEDTTDHPTRIDMVGLRAAARLRLGQWEEAHRAACEAAALIAKISPPTAYPQYHGYAAVAETCLELLRRSRQDAALSGIAAAVEKEAKQALRDLHTYRRVFAIGRPQAWRYQGLYEQLLGNDKKARKAWERGLASATTLGMPYEIGMLHYLLATAATATATERARHLARAADSFEALGSARLSEMVEGQRD